MAWIGRAGLGEARQGLARQGTTWNLAWHGAARRGGARLGKARPGSARQGIWQGRALHGGAGHGAAWQGTWAGTSASTTNQHNNMDSESLHSNALMNYAGLLYSAYMQEARAHHNMTTPTWADFVCDPLNKVSVFCWVEVARVALKIETEVRDAQL